MKHFTEIKPDMFSLDNLISWLRAQPPEAAYCYTDHGCCLLSQYFTAMGLKGVAVYSSGIFYHSCAECVTYPVEWDDIASRAPHLFGAALRRAVRKVNA